MKILVMSDSHGNKNNMLDAVDIESPDWILHLGDNDRDCTDIELIYPEIPLRSIRGNGDYFSANLDIDEFVLGDKRFFMSHGHLFGVKTGKTRITEAAINRGADILLFGHTHVQYQSNIDNMLVLNPGSIGYGRKSYAVLEIKDGVISCELKHL